MDEPKPLNSLFKEKLFRVPDYQRGYAWQREQLKDFWEDLVNLSGDRNHYTGVLTLRQIPRSAIPEHAKEYWLVEDHSYQLFHVVDGQQRLTTFVIFLQAFVDLLRGLPENCDKADDRIYVTESLSVAELCRRFLFETKPTGDRFRTYKFGYTEDNPSYSYLRFRILGEEGGGSTEETFYTLNLSNAKSYFGEQLRELHQQEGLRGLHNIYKKLTKRFLFNEYVIKDDFDVFVAFETMNNRGKKLSDLELLKNRLIYLTTLYNDDELDLADRTSLRAGINDAWKEVYHQLGRNKSRPLNDDDFLRAHWTMYFKYSRKTGQDYIQFLLDEQFTPSKVHKKVEREVVLEGAQEQRSETESDESIEDDDTRDQDAEQTVTVSSAQLRPGEIRDFIDSLKESAVHWFNSFYPDFAGAMSQAERTWIDRLNRVGMVYFRPLVMAILKNVEHEGERVAAFQFIERFVFIVFRLTSARANYRSSEFYNLARALDRGEIALSDISIHLNDAMGFTFSDQVTLRADEFYNILFKKFKNGSGYYGWSGMRYFLYEYELSLCAVSRQKKVDWTDLLKTPRDKISIEHIYPQTESPGWEAAFSSVLPEDRHRYTNSLGNLLLLSMSINASLQNESFDEKKHVKLNSAGEKIRNGYEDGSHSEIEVSRSGSWGPDEIKARGMRLLKFMQERWLFRFKDDADLEKLLFLASEQAGSSSE